MKKLDPILLRARPCWEVPGRRSYSILNTSKENIGVKLWYIGKRQSRKPLRKYRFAKLAISEFYNHVRAYKRSKLIVKPYRLVYTYIDKSLYIGYLMQHIKGEHPDIYGVHYRLDTVIDKKLYKAGIDHRDLHCGNIILTKDKLFRRRAYVIDLDPIFVKIKPRM